MSDLLEIDKLGFEVADDGFPSSWTTEEKTIARKMNFFCRKIHSKYRMVPQDYMNILPDTTYIKWFDRLLSDKIEPKIKKF